MAVFSLLSTFHSFLFWLPCFGGEVFLFFSCIFKKYFVPLIKLKNVNYGKTRD